MDNQHIQIKGYRDLSQEEINLMNKIKALAEQVGELYEEIVEHECSLYTSYDDYNSKYGNMDDNLGWTESGKKDLQLGFMQLVRAVAKPQSF